MCLRLTGLAFCINKLGRFQCFHHEHGRNLWKACPANSKAGGIASDSGRNAFIDWSWGERHATTTSDLPVRSLFFVHLEDNLSVLGRTCLWRTVSDSISGAENCTVTRRSPAHWPVMSEGNRHVFNHLLYQILAWNFSSNVIRWHGFIFGLVCQGFEVLGRLDAAIFRLCREFLICSWRQNNPAISELLFLICS